MIKTLNKKILRLAIILLPGTTALGEVFEYSQNVYGIDASTCQHRAVELADKIARATGGMTKASYCGAANGGGFDVRILTEVGAQPALEMAIFGFTVIQYKEPGHGGPANKRYSVISDEGSYIHVEECLKSLPVFEEHFRSQTGLEPLSVQCAALAGRRYVPQIDAIGTGSQHLFETSIGIGSGNSSEASQLDVGNYLRTVGATPTNSARPSSFVKIKYFASQELSLTAYDFSSKNNFITEAECLAAVNAVQPVLSKRQQLNLVSLRCGRGQWSSLRGSSSMVAIFDLTASGQQSTGLNVYTYGQFQSYADCSAKVPTTPDSFCAADIDIYGNFHGYALNVIQ